MTLTPRSILNEVLRDDLTSFIRKSFHELNPGEKFHDNWHIRAMAYHLDKVMRGDIKRLIIAVPPRHLKSISASIAFTAWYLGHNPHQTVINVSYGEDLAHELAHSTLRVLQSSWFKDAFPDATLARSNPAANNINFAAGGKRYATSVGGALTGIGGDVIVIDDPINAKDAQSEAMRRHVHDWYGGTLLSRLNNPKSGAIVIVSQRLHVDDLIGYVQEFGEWELLELPLLAEKPAEIPLDERFVESRPLGSILHEGLYSHNSVEELRKSMPERHFEAQYQQQPQIPDGNFYKLGEFGRYEGQLSRYKDSLIVQSWDTAITSSTRADYSVCTTWLADLGCYFLLDVYRKRLNYVQLKSAAYKLYEKYDPDYVLIENAANGNALWTELRQCYPDQLLRFKKVDPKGSKETRADNQSAKIAQGRVYIPTDKPWVEAFMKEVASFPIGRHDDQVDAMNHFLHATDYIWNIPKMHDQTAPLPYAE